jgi:hypothetical protein
MTGGINAQQMIGDTIDQSGMTARRRVGRLI